MYGAIKQFNTPQLRDLKIKFAEKIGYVPSVGQAKVHLSEKRFRVPCAGARFGKSMCAGFEIAFYALFPDFRTWIVGPVYELAEKEFTWALEFLSRYKLSDGRSLLDFARVSSPSRGSRSLVFPWGAFVKTKSTEKTESLLGEELDLIVLAEASCIPREPWQRMLRARIGPRNGGLLAPSTGAGDSGLFAEFVANGKSPLPEFADWESWEFSTKENPTFSDEEYAAARKDLDPSVFAEQYEGKLVSRRGYVFAFDEQKHVSEVLPLHYESLPIIVGLQPGFKNPCVAVFFAVSKKSAAGEIILYAYDEIYVLETLLSEVIGMIQKKIVGRRLLGVLTDYWNKEALSVLEKAGLPVRTNEEEKNVGKNFSIISKVRMLKNCFAFSKKHPTIFIHPRCKRVIEDFKRCKWPDKTKEDEDKLESEMPLPKYFQSPQAIAHVVAFLYASMGIDIYAMQRR